MPILDQPESFESIDPQSMKSLVESFPEQIHSAAQSGRAVSLPTLQKPNTLLVAGLGGSAIGGDLARSVAGPSLDIPLIVCRDYDLPAFVGKSSILFACSYSGNTEETLSAYAQARQAGASIICITSGGKLKDAAKADSCPLLSLPTGLPPRAALGHSLIMLLHALQSLQLIPDINPSINETVDLLAGLRERYKPSVPQEQNSAKSVAQSLHGKVVAIYGSNQIMDAVAFRMRSQIEENAKNLAFHHVVPEMNHNELVGWQYPADVLGQIGVVLIRDRKDHPQVQRRFELSREIIEKTAGCVHEIWSEGESLLARILSAIYFGDFLSLYMAYLNKVDPTPVKVIDYFKSKLSEAG